MCILLYVKLIWSSGVAQISGRLEEDGLYVKLMQGSGIPQIYGQLEGVHLPQVYVHSVICETYSVQWYSIDLWPIGGGRHWYICILLCVKLICCSGIPQIYGQLGVGVCLPCVYVHSAICETDLVQWCCIDLWSIGAGWAICYIYAVQWYSIHLWSIGGDGPWYMCILLYVKLIQCRGVPQIYGQLEGEHLILVCTSYE